MQHVQHEQRLLSSPVGLHDVRDIGLLARSILNNQLRRWGAWLDPHRYEDALSYLIGTAYELSLKYDKSRGWSFSKVCTQFLSFRLVDWYRATLGDGRAPKPELPLSLDAAVAAADADGTGNGWADLERTFADRAALGPDDRCADRVGFFA